MGFDRLDEVLPAAVATTLARLGEALPVAHAVQVLDTSIRACRSSTCSSEP